MKTGPIPGSWLVMALIAAAGMPATATNAGDEKAPAPMALPQTADLALVPDDAVGFVTVRVAGLTEKLGLQGRCDKLACLNDFKKTVGLPFDAIEQCTCAMMDVQVEGVVIIVRTAEPYRQRDILKTYLQGAKKVKLQGKTCHIDAEKRKAVCFFDKHLLVLAESEKSLALCLKQAGAKRRDQALDVALKRASPCDLAVWARATALPGGELALPRGLESGLLTVDAGAQLAINVHISCTDPDAANWAVKALRSGVDLARAALLVVPITNDACELFPATIDKNVLKTMRLFPVTLMRQVEKGLQKALVTSDDTQVAMSVSIPVDGKALRAEVADAIRIIEKASDGSELLAGFSAWDLTPTFSGMTLPSGRYLEHRPQYLPDEPAFPLKKELASQEGTIGPGVPGNQAQAPVGAPTGSASGNQSGVTPAVERRFVIESTPPGAKVYLNKKPVGFTPCDVEFLDYGTHRFQLELDGYQTFDREEVIRPASSSTNSDIRRFNFELTPLSKPNLFQQPSGSPNPLQVQAPIPPVPVPVNPTVLVKASQQPVAQPKTAIKLAVANVRKEPALLFTMADDGKLSFVQKVAAGDAIDVQTTAGQRWVAVFTDNPAGETYTALQTEGIWLLRSPPLPKAEPGPAYYPSTAPYYPSTGGYR